MEAVTVLGSGRARRNQLEAILKLDRVNVPVVRQMEEEQEADESLVADHRGSMKPAQHVERKLVTMLQTSAVCISLLQKDARPRGK